MRRNTLSFTVLSLVALAALIGACANAPGDDDLGELTANQQPTAAAEDTSNTTLPSTSSNSGKDAGTPAKDAGTPAKDAATPPPPPPPPPTTGEECGELDPMALVKIFMGGDLTPCPCSAGQCCLAMEGQELGCIDK